MNVQPHLSAEIWFLVAAFGFFLLIVTSAVLRGELT
jgi:hypothetical protein